MAERKVGELTLDPDKLTNEEKAQIRESLEKGIYTQDNSSLLGDIIKVSILIIVVFIFSELIRDKGVSHSGGQYPMDECQTAGGGLVPC